MDCPSLANPRELLAPGLAQTYHLMRMEWLFLIQVAPQQLQTIPCNYLPTGVRVTLVGPGETLYSRWIQRTCRMAYSSGLIQTIQLDTVSWNQVDL